MNSILRPLKQALPVKILGRVAGYVGIVFATAIAVTILSRYDFSGALGSHGHHHHLRSRSSPGKSKEDSGMAPGATQGSKDALSTPASLDKAADAAALNAAPTKPRTAEQAHAQATKFQDPKVAEQEPAVQSAAVMTSPQKPTAAAAADGPGEVLPAYMMKHAPGPDGCKEMKKMIILHWDPHWAWHRNPNGLKDAMNCEKLKINRCIMWYTTSDRSFASKADIIVAHDWSGYPALPERAFPTQLFMYMTMESPYSGYSAQHLQHLFNLEYKYMLHSHVRAAYIPIGEKSYNEIHGASHYAFKDKIPDAVSSLVSNCGGYVPRLTFMQELNKRVPVHSFGRCFHNRELKSYHDISSLEQYKVAMVFENSMCYDYVSEKWWRALTQATIPLVTSNERIPDYRKYAPSLDCYLDYGQFKDMDALAAEIKKIMTDEAVYNKYMAYRTWPEEKFNPIFRSNFSSSSCDDFCRLGLKMLDTDEMAKLVKRRNPRDNSCRGHGILK